MQLYLYHTLGCHLCELAEAVVSEVESQSAQSYSLTKIDIAASDELFALYGIRIPVLQAQGCSTTLDWPFDSTDLHRYLANR
jgi:hypothetical protein